MWKGQIHSKAVKERKIQGERSENMHWQSSTQADNMITSRLLSLKHFINAQEHPDSIRGLTNEGSAPPPNLHVHLLSSSRSSLDSDADTNTHGSRHFTSAADTQDSSHLWEKKKTPQVLIFRSAEWPEGCFVFYKRTDALQSKLLKRVFNWHSSGCFSFHFTSCLHKCTEGNLMFYIVFVYQMCALRSPRWRATSKDPLKWVGNCLEESASVPAERVTLLGPPSQGTWCASMFEEPSLAATQSVQGSLQTQTLDIKTTD